MSCLLITYQLLCQIKSFCTEVKCLFIQESEFEWSKDTNINAWLFFCNELAPNLNHLGVDNTIKIQGQNSPAFHQLFERCKLTEIQVVFNESFESESIDFADSFRSLRPKKYVYLSHRSNGACYNCICKCTDFGTHLANVTDLPPMSNLNKLLFHLKENSKNELAYLRLETDECPIESVQSFDIISHFNELKAFNLNFNNSFFDEIETDHSSGPGEIDQFLTTIFEPMISKLPKLESLTGRLGDFSVSDLLLGKQPFGPNIQKLKFRGGTFEPDVMNKIVLDYSKLERFELENFDFQTYDNIPDMFLGLNDLNKFVVGTNDFNTEELERVLTSRRDIRWRDTRSKVKTYFINVLSRPSKPIKFKILPI